MTKQYTRIIAVPPNLPNDDLETPDLFAKCLGHSFEVIDRKGNMLELAVGAMRGEAPYMHSIWIETQFTDSSQRSKLRLIMQCLLCDGFSESEQDTLITMGRVASPDPAWTNYLYWPDRFGLDGSVDAALNKAFAYQPIILGATKS